MSKENPKIGFTIGDINGIGPEILINTLTKRDYLEFFTPVVYAHTRLFGYYKNVLKIKELNYNGISSASEAVAGKINVINVLPKTLNFSIGNETEEGGEYARLSLLEATKAAEKGEIDILVTAPVNKNNFYTDTFSYAGHTDYLKSYFKKEPLMFMVSDEIKVAVCTHHIPLKSVASSLNKDLIANRIQQINLSLKQDFGISKPRIAVMGLNPHAGDNGLIGKEEKEMIAPVIKKLFDSGVYCFGPYSADSFFLPQNLNSFDAVLAMYHDQGLIPFKTLCFGKGVNYTAALPIVRVSPDHGVAYDIAGKNQAETESFTEAIFRGLEIYKLRKEYSDLQANKLGSIAGKSVEDTETELDEDLSEDLKEGE